MFDWPMWRLECFAAEEARYWPRVYLRESALCEAVWWGIYGREGVGK